MTTYFDMGKNLCRSQGYECLIPSPPAPSVKKAMDFIECLGIDLVSSVGIPSNTGAIVDSKSGQVLGVIKLTG